MNTREHYLTIWKAVHDLRQEAKTYDAKLDDMYGDGNNARSPTGDDYNRLMEIIEYHTGILPYVRYPKRIVKPTLLQRAKDFFVWNLGWNI